MEKTVKIISIVHKCRVDPHTHKLRTYEPDLTSKTLVKESVLSAPFPEMMEGLKDLIEEVRIFNEHAIAQKLSGINEGIEDTITLHNIR